MMNEKDKKELLNLARSAVEAAVKGDPLPDHEIKNINLQSHRGVFVTLKTKGHLRGCLGRFISDKPLWKTVREMSVAAATEDPRFVANRITRDELKELEIEISVLSPLQKTNEPLEDLKIGKHGIYISRQERSGCFLPQVAQEMGWGKKQFLDDCCSHKAALPAESWKNDPDTDVYIFTADVFSSQSLS